MSGIFAEALAGSFSASEHGDVLAAAGPTNQQIVDAATKAYGAHEAAVDGMTSAAAGYFASASGAEQASVLNAYDWSQKQVDGALVSPVWQDPTVGQALETIKADKAIVTVVAGVLGAGETNGTTQGIGFGSPANDLTSFTGEQFVVAPDISDPEFASATLQIGLWTKAPSVLSLAFYGLQVYSATSPGSPVLKIFLLSDLTTYGFSIGLGVKPGLTSALMHGTTNIFL